MKIFVIGASGKVGRQCISSLFFSGALESIHTVLHARNADRIRGFLLDIESALPIYGVGSASLGKPYMIDVTSSLSDMEGADLVIVLAGRWATTEQKKQFGKIDASGRLVQSYVNYGLISAVARSINKYAATATVLVVTNQSDMMAELTRSFTPNAKVFGFGGTLDTARFRVLLWKCLREKNHGKKYTLRGIDGHLAGFHNNSMMYLRNTVSVDYGKLPRSSWIKVADIALHQTKEFGKSISTLQKSTKLPSIDSGASICPGYSVGNFILAFAGQREPLDGSYNSKISLKSSEIFGVSPGSNLSIPLRIGKNAIVPLPGVVVDEDEKELLRAAQNMLKTDMEMILKLRKDKDLRREFGIYK